MRQYFSTGSDARYALKFYFNTDKLACQTSHWERMSHLQCGGRERFLRAFFSSF